MDVEQLGIEEVRLRDAGVAGCRLTRDTTTLASEF